MLIHWVGEEKEEGEEEELRKERSAHMVGAEVPFGGGLLIEISLLTAANEIIPFYIGTTHKQARKLQR